MDLLFPLTALWRTPSSRKAMSSDECCPTSTMPLKKILNSFSTKAHQAWSTENSISCLNRSKRKRIKLEPEPSLNCKWLRWSSQPISCIKSKAWSLACNSSVAPRKPSAVSAASIMLSRVRISEQTSFSATIKGKKLLQRPWSST